MYSRILATGSALPARVVTNSDLENMVDTSDERIRARTGISQRHVAGDDETVCDLSEKAALKALEMAGMDAKELVLIVMGTTTPDQIFPNTAVLLQERLGVFGIPAFTLEAACSGFIYALSVADQFIRAGNAKCVLVLGAEKITSLIDWTDRNTCVLFGDGAGAVILTASDEPGIISTHLHADGRYKDLLYFPSGPGKNFRTIANDYLQMKGAEVFKVAVTTLGAAVEEALQANGLSKSDIDWLIPHQANTRLLQAIAKRLDLPMEPVIMTVEFHGNTSAASIPLALDTAVRDGRVKRGDMLLLDAFGGGFTWGSAMVKF